MPVQIKEILVKATVGNTSSAESGGGGDSGNCESMIAEIKSQIIDECLTSIFFQLNKNKER